MSLGRPEPSQTQSHLYENRLTTSLKLQRTDSHINIIVVFIDGDLNNEHAGFYLQSKEYYYLVHPQGEREKVSPGYPLNKIAVWHIVMALMLARMIHWENGFYICWCKKLIDRSWLQNYPSPEWQFK